MTAPKYTAADLEMAAFMASRKPWVVQKERYRLSMTEAEVSEYDRITDYNLAFLRGQTVAEETALNTRRTAA